MMATAELIRAYLDWQSEMGSDEVILPLPLARRSAALATSIPAPSGISTMVGQVDAGRMITTVGPKVEVAEKDFLPGQSSGGKSQVGYPTAIPGSGVIAPADLFASLTQALSTSPESRTGESGTGGNARSTVRGPEILSLPAFADLAALWEHLERELEQGAKDANSLGTRMVRGFGPVKSLLALVGFEPGEADMAESRPFQGEPGVLLEKMMRAIRLDIRELYQTQLIKVRVSGKVWSRRELIRLTPLLHVELRLAQAPMVLLLGQECAQAVLKTGKTLDELRQETHRMEGREFFVTYHPEELLRKEELKRKAWEDLQWLQRRLAQENGLARP
ncbi:MAG: uracil-DNA glycosylase family protein [Fibrobacteria bacterium]